MGRTPVGMARAGAMLVTLSAVVLSCAPAPVGTDRVRVFDVVGRPESEWGYDPKEIRIDAGTTVTFMNAGAVFHTVTSDDPARTFDVGVLPGERATVRFDRPGTFAYHCGVHPDMKGVVHVCDGACR